MNIDKDIVDPNKATTEWVLHTAIALTPAEVALAAKAYTCTQFGMASTASHKFKVIVHVEKV